MPLRTVKGMDVRPTTDRTKETLFNILMPYIPNGRFLDLFAGTGAIGIEALSRGAACAFFVEKARAHQELILENLDFTRLAENATLIRGDVLQVLPRLSREEPFDVIFLDPPFEKDLELPTLAGIVTQKLLAPDGVIVVESSPKTDLSGAADLGLTAVKERVYSKSRHTFFKPTMEK